MKIKHNPPNPYLTALLEAAKSHKMTPEEADAQRRSWIRGNIGLSYPEMPAEQLDGLMRLALGPSLAEQLATARTEARNAALEEAAKVAETPGVWRPHPDIPDCRRIATAIRALAGKEGK